MVYGKTPFQHLKPLQKLHAIVDDKHAIDFPPHPNGHLMDVLQRCLSRQPQRRPTISDLLDHPFLHPERTSLPAKDEAAAFLREVASAQIAIPPSLQWLCDAAPRPGVTAPARNTASSALEPLMDDDQENQMTAARKRSTDGHAVAARPRRPLGAVE